MTEKQDVVEMLERVFLKLGSAEDDNQFEAALRKYLPAVLLQLKSPEDGVRKKVLEMLVHINKRLKSRPSIQLPLEALLPIYADVSDAASSSFVHNFCIIYLKMGLERLDHQSQARLAPKLLRILEDKPHQHQEGIIFLLLPLLGSIPFEDTQSLQDRKATLGLEDRPQTKKLLLDMMFDLLLLPYGIFTPSPPTLNSSANSNAAVPGTGGAPPPGMSRASLKRITGENPLSPEHLESAKLSILHFIGHGIFDDDEVVVHLVVASSDTRHAIATAAESALKRCANAEDWNRPSTVMRMFDIFLGDAVAKKKSAMNLSEEEKRSAASTRLRLKLFPLLLKSRQSAEHFPALVQVVFDCLFSSPSTNSKLKINAVRLVHHASEFCGDKIFKLSGTTLMPAMTKVVKEMEEEVELCSLALVAIGKIGRRLPKLVQEDIAFLQTNFDALATVTGSKLSALQEMLSLLVPCFDSLGEPQRSLLEAVVMQNGELPAAPSRLMALKYACVCFPRNHMPSRYVVLLCAGDPRDEVRAEAAKILKTPQNPVMPPTKIEDHKESKIAKLEERQYPNFGVAADYLYQRGKFSDQRRGAGGRDEARVQVFAPSMMVEVAAFLRACLAAEAGCPSEEIRPELNVAEMKYQAPTVTKYIGRALKEDPSSQSPVRKYKNVVDNFLQQQGSAESLYLMTELVAADGIIAREVGDSLDWIRDKFLFSPRDDVREAAAQLYAVLVAMETESRFLTQIRTLLVCLGSESNNLEKLSGSILGLGASLGRRSLAFECCSSNEITKLVNEAVTQLSSKLQHSSSLVQLSAVTAITEIAQFAQLPLPDGEMPSEKEIDKEAKEETYDQPSTKADLATTLLDFVSSSKHPAKLREKCAVAAAALCCGARSWSRSKSTRFPHEKEIMKRLMEASKVKELELHFHVGAALTTAAMGTGSKLASDSWTADEEILEYKARNAPTENLEFLVEQLTKSYLNNDNKHVKQAAAAWTICLMQEAGHLPYLQRHLTNIQESVLRLLFVDEEITQELAAKTLGICYSCSTEESRANLVSNLCESLVGSEESKSSDSGSEISKSSSKAKSTAFFGVGSKASAYRELAAIAIELKQPDLVYKLIYLAHKNSSLKTPGVAASLTGGRRHAEIAAEASRQLTPHMSTMVPKLFRYLHDPDVKIQTAMSSIWQALVPTDSNAVVDAHLEGVLEELLREIENRGSVVRESCCTALTEVLRGRALNPIVAESLGKIWKAVLSRLDDVKETVRKAAKGTAKMTVHVTILACDTNNGKLGSKAIAVTLPILLEDGLYSSKESEIRSLVLDTLQKLSRQTGPLLRPHLARLMPALLEAVSGLESSSLNYLSLRLAGTDRLDVQEKLDDARISASNSSPLMETLKFCIQFVDDEVMVSLAPSLVEVLKSGTGMATKAAAAELVIAFVFQRAAVVEPHAPKLMSALLGGLSDRQSGVRRTFSTAIGHLAKVASAKTLDKALDKLKVWYLEKPHEERDLRRACESAMSAISKHAPDRLKEHAKHAMPLAFVAMHEHDDENMNDGTASAGWLEIWTEVTPGMESGIHLYLKEIVQMITSTLSFQSWGIRAQAGRAASTLAQRLPHDKMDPKILKSLLEAVAIEGLGGRTWEGKEALLEATQQLCCQYKRFFCRGEIDMEIDGDDLNDPLLTMRPSLLSTLLREARKENLIYKRVAVDCASRVIEAWGEYEKFSDLGEIVITRLKKMGDDGDDDVMEHDGNRNSSPRLEFEESALESLGRAFPASKPSQKEEVGRDTIATLVLRSSNLHSWKIRLSALKGLSMVAEKHWQLKESVECVRPDELNAVVEPMIKAALQNIANEKYVMLRKVSVEILETILKSPSGLIMAREVLDQAVQPLTAMKLDNNVELQKKSEELLKLLS